MAGSGGCSEEDEKPDATTDPEGHREWDSSRHASKAGRKEEGSGIGAQKRRQRGMPTWDTRARAPEQFPGLTLVESTAEGMT
jgi:hypothetical protein